MTYVYLASATEDLPLAQRLSADLSEKSIENWYHDEQATEETIWAHLEKASCRAELCTFNNIV